MKWQDLLRKMRREPRVKELRQKGSHVQFGLPDGSVETILDSHADVGKGLERKILKHLAKAGIILTVFLAACAWLL